MKPADEVIVLVGGFGTRLQQVVADVPKPLAPVAGRPFLAYLLDGYANAGMRRAILATGYRAEQVRAFAGARWSGMEIAYSHEDVPLGTGGAIRQAAALVRGHGVHVANGDTWLRHAPQALEAAARREGTRMAVALVEVDDTGRYGAVEVQGGLARSFREKGGQGPGLINGGSYYLAPDALAMLPDEPAFSFETRVLQPWAADGQVAVCSDTGGFIDIGVPEDYARAQQLFADGP